MSSCCQIRRNDIIKVIKCLYISQVYFQWRWECVGKFHEFFFHRFFFLSSNAVRYDDSNIRRFFSLILLILQVNGRSRLCFRWIYYDKTIYSYRKSIKKLLHKQIIRQNWSFNIQFEIEVRLKYNKISFLDSSYSIRLKNHP